ncbi:MAG TPA: hypothetical protein VMV92_42795 [Streptosporangiaceae bacterium]|nr:hypothetical protein [Streptosporangiaceae bacterium]
MASTFSVDVAAIRDRARQKMDQEPVTESYGEDPADVISILNEDVATDERIVISTYQEIIRWLGDDVTSRRMLEEILADEEEHADDIVDLLGA